MNEESACRGKEQPASVSEPWRSLCERCNAMRREEPEGWWERIATDAEAVLRVDEAAIEVRLRGSRFAEVELRGDATQCRIPHEYLLLSHPGERAVLGGSQGTPGPGRVQALGDLAAHYDHVRRRVMHCSDRRQAILDRLYLRHHCVLAVDAPFPSGRVDLVALSAQGAAVFFLLRRYDDGDLRLRGRGGIAWRLGELARWLGDGVAAETWVLSLLERSRALHAVHARRYAHTGKVTVQAVPRLLVVDFDHARRLAGLPRLREDLQYGLDQEAVQGDIHCLGDPGNISYTTFFSGL